MMTQLKTTRFIVLCLLVLVAALTRIIPVYFPGAFNFTAVGALAVFAGAHIRDKRLAFFVPLLSMLISDAIIGFHEGMPIVYAGFVAMVACGVLIRNKVAPGNIAWASIAGTVAFYLITNFAFLYPWYPHTMQGIIQSYAAGLPFLRNMLIADVIYGTILFGGFYLLERNFNSIRYDIVKTA